MYCLNHFLPSALIFVLCSEARPNLGRASEGIFDRIQREHTARLPGNSGFARQVSTAVSYTHLGGLVGRIGGLTLIEGVRVGLEELLPAILNDTLGHLHGQGIGALPLVQHGHGLGEGAVSYTHLDVYKRQPSVH